MARPRIMRFSTKTSEVLPRAIELLSWLTRSPRAGRTVLSSRALRPRVDSSTTTDTPEAFDAERGHDRGGGPVDAILGAYTSTAFDDCGRYINPIEGHHLHGAVGCGEVEVDGHAAVFGYSLDGYAIHRPYDENSEVYGDLDQCAGHTTVELGYHTTRRRRPRTR